MLRGALDQKHDDLMVGFPPGTHGTHAGQKSVENKHQKSKAVPNVDNLCQQQWQKFKCSVAS